MSAAQSISHGPHVTHRLLGPLIGVPTTFWGFIFRVFSLAMLLSAVCPNGPVCSMFLPLVLLGFEGRAP